jgi:hypothetical protein
MVLRDKEVRVNRDLEDRTLVSLMVGHEVVVEHMAGPRIDDEAKVKQVWEGEEPLTGPLEVRISAVYLQRYNQLGIGISRGPEGGRERFIPWGAVILSTEFPDKSC